MSSRNQTANYGSRRSAPIPSSHRRCDPYQSATPPRPHRHSSPSWRRGDTQIPPSYLTPGTIDLDASESEEDPPPPPRHQTRHRAPTRHARIPSRRPASVAAATRGWDANQQLQRINALEDLLRAEQRKVKAEETLRRLAEARLEDLELQLGIRDSLNPQEPVPGPSRPRPRALSGSSSTDNLGRSERHAEPFKMVRITSFRTNFPHEWDQSSAEPHLTVISKVEIHKHLDEALARPYSVVNIQLLNSWWSDAALNFGFKRQWLLAQATSEWWSALRNRTVLDDNVTPTIKAAIHTICEDKRSEADSAKRRALEVYPGLSIEGVVYSLE